MKLKKSKTVQDNEKICESAESDHAFSQHLIIKLIKLQKKIKVFLEGRPNFLDGVQIAVNIQNN